MARVQLHIRAVLEHSTNAEVTAIVHAAEALQKVVEAAHGEYGGTPDFELDDVRAAAELEKADLDAAEQAVEKRPRTRGQR